MALDPVQKACLEAAASAVETGIWLLDSRIEEIRAQLTAVVAQRDAAFKRLAAARAALGMKTIVQ